MAFVASQGQQLRLTSQTQDAEARVFVGPKHSVSRLVGTPGLASSTAGLTDVTDRISDIGVNGRLDEYAGEWTASLKGVRYDSTLISADVLILVQGRFYPDQAGAAVGTSLGGSWTSQTVGSSTVAWSPWKDVYVGYVVDGSIEKTADGAEWSCRCEGESQYLKRSQAPAISFGRKNLTKGKTVKTSSVLQSPFFERAGSGAVASEGEFIGSPDVSGSAAVDEDRATLWISDGFPSIDAAGEYNPLDKSTRLVIDGIGTRSPIPGRPDYLFQWISFYNGTDAENTFFETQANSGGNVEIAIAFRDDVSATRSGVTDDRARYRVMRPKLLGASVGSKRRLVMCYSKDAFHEVFGPMSDVTVIEWGRMYPGWVMDYNRGEILLVQPGESASVGSGNFRYVWPIGWDGGNFTPSSPRYLITSCFWGQGQPVHSFKIPDHTDGDPPVHHPERTGYLTPQWQAPVLAPQHYAQAHVSGGGTGFDDTTRPAIAQGTQRKAEWLTVDLGGFFTKLTQQYDPGESALYVESTAGYAPSGRLQVEASIYAYTSRTDEQFLGASLSNGVVGTHPVGTLVYQIDAAGHRLDMPLIGSVRYQRPLGKSVPMRGSVRLSDQESPKDPLADESWESDWSAKAWRFTDFTAGRSVPSVSTYELPVSPPVRARHICFFVEKQSLTTTGDNYRAKLNEVAAYEPAAQASDGPVPPDANGNSDTGAVLQYYVVTKYGMPQTAVSIASGVTFADIDVAEADYWQIATQLAERTDHVFVCDRWNRLSYAPHPVYGLQSFNLPTWFSWTEDRMDQVTYNVLQSGRVGQVVLRGRDSALQSSYVVEYPDSPQTVGTKKVIEDVLIYGTASLAQRAERHFRYENRKHSISWKTGIADEIDLGQRHRISATIDEAGIDLVNQDFIVTGVDMQMSLDEDGHLSFTTSITAEELV